MHLFTHARTHSLTHTLTHLLTHSFMIFANNKSSGRSWGRNKKKGKLPRLLKAKLLTARTLASVWVSVSSLWVHSYSATATAAVAVWMWMCRQINAGMLQTTWKSTSCQNSNEYPTSEYLYSLHGPWIPFAFKQLLIYIQQIYSKIALKLKWIKVNYD